MFTPKSQHSRLYSNESLWITYVINVVDVLTQRLQSRTERADDLQETVDIADDEVSGLVQTVEILHGTLSRVAQIAGGYVQT